MDCDECRALISDGEGAVIPAPVPGDPASDNLWLVHRGECEVLLKRRIES